MSIFFAGNELRQRKGIFYPSFDPDFLAWYNLVIAAGSSISAPNIVTLDKFFRDLKTNNLWSAITQANILCGVNDLVGALIPIKGATPINNGFISGNYDVTAGLNSTSLNNKWLNTTILESSFSTNPDSVGRHMYCSYTQFIPSAATNRYVIGSATTGGSRIYTPSINSLSVSGQLNSGSTSAMGLASSTNSFVSVARQNGILYKYAGGILTTAANTIGTITTTNTIGVFGAPGQARVNMQMTFYSFGYYLDASILNSVVTTMTSALV